jgi:hypothetical protein
MMKQTFKATEINVGFHPDGYRIDKTASPMNFYTKWEISEDGKWLNPKPVDFDALPEDGWFKAEGFDWNGVNATMERA